MFDPGFTGSTNVYHLNPPITNPIDGTTFSTQSVLNVETEYTLFTLGQTITQPSVNISVPSSSINETITLAPNLTTQAAIQQDFVTKFNANTNLQAFFTTATIVNNIIEFDADAVGDITVNFTFNDGDGDITGTATATDGTRFVRLYSYHNSSRCP